MDNPQNSSTPFMGLSDRALAELGALFGLISIAGVGVPMIWPDEKFVGAIFLLFGGGGFVVVAVFAVIRICRERGAKLGMSLAIIGTFLIILGGAIGLIGAFKIDALFEASDPARSNLQKKPVELPELLDLFKADFPALLKLEAEKVASLPGAPDYKFTSKAYFDFSAKTWFGAFFLPRGNQSYPVSVALAEDHAKVLGDLRNGAFAKVKVPGDSSPTDTEELVFSGRIFIYHEDDFTLRQQADLTDLYKSKGLSLQLRGRDYVISRWNDQRLKSQP